MADQDHENWTMELYPEMMRGTKLLVIDYDVTRYHSFDLFRYELLNRDNFYRCRSKFLPMIQEPEYDRQILQYMKLGDVNPMNNFVNNKYSSASSMEDRLGVMFQDERARVTPTDVSRYFEPVFKRDDIDGFLLRYRKDPHRPVFIDDVKTYETDHMLDLAMVVAIVEKEGINAIMCSSIRLAYNMINYLIQRGITRGLTVLVASYSYNTDVSGYYEPQILRAMAALEYNYHYEFGIFNPFISLVEQARSAQLSDQEPNSTNKEETPT